MMYDRHGMAWRAGILCALVSQPADNMVSKLSNNPNATMGSVMAEMGIVKLFTAGLPLRILMVGTLTGLQWGIYDAFKVRNLHGAHGGLHVMRLRWQNASRSASCMSSVQHSGLHIGWLALEADHAGRCVGTAAISRRSLKTA